LGSVADARKFADLMPGFGAWVIRTLF